MTPLLAALSSCLLAVFISSVAVATSPASAASRNLRMAVFSEDLTDLLRRRACSLVLMRLICDLMLATVERPRSVCRGLAGARQRHTLADEDTAAARPPAWATRVYWCDTPRWPRRVAPVGPGRA